MFNADEAMQVYPIGRMHNRDGVYRVAIREAFRPGLHHLGQFGHVLVFWWLDANDNAEARRRLQVNPSYAPGEVVGVFACRAPVRPNPVAMTISAVQGVDEEAGVVYLDYTDAHDGSPVIDLKPYIPVNERVRNFKTPGWFDDWPVWQEESAGFDHRAKGDSSERG